ncbi:hypothetical protein TOK_4236 [Pseudonocardia sp. N23]|nr:hypothetical protein TOK_4236 [Pseudonocardia sp. N23]
MSGAAGSMPSQCAAAGPPTVVASPAHSHAARPRTSPVRRCPAARYTAGCNGPSRPPRHGAAGSAGSRRGPGPASPRRVRPGGAAGRRARGHAAARTRAAGPTSARPFASAHPLPW